MRAEMRIWVDADACPKAVKDVLFRAAQRLEVGVILVANQYLATPASAYVRAVQVESGFDVADNYIVHHSSAGDLSITADIPLAAELVAKDVLVLGPRGERFTKENIQQRLSMRNFMEEMRNSGQATGGPTAYSNTDKQSFANALDRLLVSMRR